MNETTQRRFGALKLVAPALAVASLLALTGPAAAWDRGGGNVAAGVAAGIIGGAAIGALAAGAAQPAPPPPAYYPAAPVYAPGYAPPPAYVEPAYPAPACWWRRRQVWDGYAWVWRRVRVCN